MNPLTTGIASYKDPKKQVIELVVQPYVPTITDVETQDFFIPAARIVNGEWQLYPPAPTYDAAVNAVRHSPGLTHLKIISVQLPA
jgi:hypothetical protein